MACSYPLPEGPQLVTPLLRRRALRLAELRLARLAVGCHLYRLKCGSFPERLAELGQKLPEHFKAAAVDPFTDKPFSYRKTETGCTIWGVGRDGKDDGGDPEKDIVFELKR